MRWMDRASGVIWDIGGWEGQGERGRVREGAGIDVTWIFFYGSVSQEERASLAK